MLKSTFCVIIDNVSFCQLRKSQLHDNEYCYGVDMADIPYFGNDMLSIFEIFDIQRTL